jgi:SAM-dependent methyltransferase
MIFKDYFSAQASGYARYRPHYPPELFRYLAGVAPAHDLAWDCGTGSGQAASGLVAHFAHVIATDPSPAQLSNAVEHPQITYRQATAEESGLNAASADLITVAQALHWFDIDRFHGEARRVLKPRGVLAVWSYALCRISPALDSIIDEFYDGIVGPYWPRERRIVDDGYRSLHFPFSELDPPRFNISQQWALPDLLGYLRTWSPTRRYIEANGEDPVSIIEPDLGRAWGEPSAERTVIWPINMRIGRV